MTSETQIGIRLNHCCCCFSTCNLQSTLSTFYHNGEPEIYADMIAKCFRLEFALKVGFKGEYKICDVCIERLREVSVFRNLVDITQKKFTRDAMEYDVKDIKTEDEDLNYDEVGIHFEATPHIGDKKSVTNQVIQSKNTKILPCKVEDYERNLIENDCKEINENEQSCSIVKTVKKKKKMEPDEKPYTIDDNNLTCPICHESFPWRLTLERHMAIHFPNHICHICAKSFIKQVSLHIHLKRHEISNKTYTCKKCDKSYKSLESLRNHARFHNDNLIYKCPQCSERFSTYSRRLQHLVNVHGDEAKKYKCKHCPKKYKRANALSSHVRAVHLQERRFVCKECNTPFFTKSGLKEHMLKHTGVKNFRCDICNKAFGRRFTLIEHMKIHYNIKNFVCTVCGRAFTQKCTLKSHMKIHEKS